MSEVSRDHENWLPVVGFEHAYEVSDQGRVRSLDRVTPCVRLGRSITRRCPGKLLNASPATSGHLQVGLRRDLAQHPRRVHTLVLEAFVGPCPTGLQGLHWDDDPSNNHVSNLRWGTPSDNVWDQSRNGRHHMKKRVRCPLGHLLRAPNLVACDARLGHRTCLACCRGRSDVKNYAQRGKVLHLHERIHWHYGRIMEAAAFPTQDESPAA